MTQTDEPTTAEAFDAIGFPSGFAERAGATSAIVDKVMSMHEAVRWGPPPRKYATPLLLTLVAQVEALLSSEQVTRYDQGLESIRSPVDERGREANQLVLKSKSGLISARPIYNRLEKLVVGSMQRLGFPSGPGYNTGQWRRFESTLDLLLTMTPGERRDAAGRLWSLIYDLPRQTLATGRAAVPRPFTLLLETFDDRQPGENEGALLQGLSYAYYRADAPNIDLDPGKSRAGSARTNRVGDLDGYSGNELVLTIEVKDERITDSSVSKFDDWLIKLPDYRNALAVAVARSFDGHASEYLTTRGVALFDREMMLQTVSLWDLGKQQLALRGFWFYLNRIEREPNMIERFDDWCDDYGFTLWFSGLSEAEAAALEDQTTDETSGPSPSEDEPAD